MIVRYWQYYVTMDLKKKNEHFFIYLMVHKNSITMETGRRISDSPKPHHGEKAFIKLVSNFTICGNSY